MLFSLFTVKVLVWQEFKLILILTVCSKQIKKAEPSIQFILSDTWNDGACSNPRSFFLGLIIYMKKTTQYLLAEKGVHFFCYTSANL